MYFKYIISGPNNLLKNPNNVGCKNVLVYLKVLKSVVLDSDVAVRSYCHNGRVQKMRCLLHFSRKWFITTVTCQPPAMVSDEGD